jgi:hypothetical protein
MERKSQWNGSTSDSEQGKRKMKFARLGEGTAANMRLPSTLGFIHNL